MWYFVLVVVPLTIIIYQKNVESCFHEKIIMMKLPWNVWHPIWFSGNFYISITIKYKLSLWAKKNLTIFWTFLVIFFVKTLTFTLIYFMLYLFQISIWTFHCNFIVVFVSHCRRFMSLKIEICFWMTFRKKKSQRLQTQNWKISNMIRDEKCSVENGILRTLVSYRNFLTSPSWSITPRTLNVFTRIGSRQGDRTTDILLDTWIWLCF